MLAVFKNLSVIRKVVQIAAFIFLVYGSAVTGFYIADKLSGTFPALSCAFNQKTADYCALIVLQHQMDHRVGAILSVGGPVMQAITPTLISMGIFLFMFVLLSKAFCGWICPVGFMQEVVTLIGQKTGLGKPKSLAEGTVSKLRPVKWGMLALLVLIFPLLTGFGALSHDFGDPFCRICPSRILTTLATGDFNQIYADRSSLGLFGWSLLGNVMFGFVVAGGVSIKQPFCRICPMLALHAAFRKVGLARLVKKSAGKCDSCGLCAKACPMDIREIHVSDKMDAMYADCTLCGRCVEFCPQKGVLSLRYATLPLFAASPEYAKSRAKAQKEWEGGAKKEASS